MTHKKKYVSKIIWFILGVLVVVALICMSLFQISKSRTFQFFGGLTSRVETNQKIVALTFDDAPTQYVTGVLAILKEKQIKATFYEIGNNIAAHPDIAKSIVDMGMEVGNHSYSHTRMVLKSQKFIDREIQKTNDLIRASGYTGEITFRPPNGKKMFGLPWYLRQHDMRTVMWDVEPDTFVAGNADAIVNYVMKHTRPGSIILMHPFCEDACKADKEALPRIIDELHVNGYTFVSISELLTHAKE